MARPAASATSRGAEACTPELVQLAHSLADAAAEVTGRYFRTPVPVDVKADASPVTIADQEAEAAMRQLIMQQCPDHSIFGEEAGHMAGSSGSSDSGNAGSSGGSSSEYLWVIDPIDGTKSFITGKPLFGTLIALLHRGTPVLGIIDQPVLKERWLGVAGRPTTLNGRPITTRQCGAIGDAHLYATTPHMFAGESEAAFNRVRDAGGWWGAAGSKGSLRVSMQDAVA
jgi:inositol-phosphate phosphatase/L-galactose 1-phosphate phosphatase/histidinol-phosphatase